MNIELQLIFSSNHHAFLIRSVNREAEFLEIKKEINATHAENIFLNLKVFDIGKAREIIKLAEAKFDSQHFIVLSFYNATLEAQNALLKFLEEPADNLKIILIVSESTYLLPTVESRLMAYPLAPTSPTPPKEGLYQTLNLEHLHSSLSFGEGRGEVGGEKSGLALKFLQTKKTERMKLKEVVEILEKEDEYAKEFENKERKDREVAENFLLELEKVIYLKLITPSVSLRSPASPREADQATEVQCNDSLPSGKVSRSDGRVELLKNLNDIQDFKKYIKLTSSSPKTILEFLSLSLVDF